LLDGKFRIRERKGKAYLKLMSSQFYSESYVRSKLERLNLPPIILGQHRSGMEIPK
jgi:hypothetical protein